MKILSVEQIRKADALTIEREPISSSDLMIRASKVFTAWFTSMFSNEKEVIIYCGPGNNGGDGLVVAKLLTLLEYRVTIVFPFDAKNISDDCKKQLVDVVKIVSVKEIEQYQNIDRKDKIIIDAFFGTGLNSPLRKPFSSIIEFLNQQKATRISIDTPSGLGIDSHLDSITFKANYTFSFQVPKLAFLFPSYAKYVGQFIIGNIGLDAKYLKEVKSNYHYVDDYFIIKAIYKPKNLFDHKGSNGRALIIAGSHGMAGAALLTAIACVKSGAGLTTLHAPQLAKDVLLNNCPEIMTNLDEKDYLSRCILDTDKFDSIGIGPGLGRRNETEEEFVRILSNCSKAIVLDADALNILSEREDLFSLIPENSILTPHPGEFERLVGKWSTDFERLEKQIELSKQLNVTVVLKGRNTSISLPNGHVFFNSTGNQGMATGGSGDVLTGIITSLLAQGYNSMEASILGVFLHGRAGDIALETESFESLAASDLITYLGRAFKSIQE